MRDAGLRAESIDGRQSDGAGGATFGDLNRGHIVRVEHVPDGAVLVTVWLSPRRGVGSVGGRASPPLGAPADGMRRDMISAPWGLTHDPDEERFYLAGRALQLPPQEYRLLRFLAQHPRRLLTYSRIMEGAWPDGFDVANLNPLHATLCRLRRRLGDAAALIQARRASGYVFAGDRLRELAAQPPAGGMR